MKHPSQISITDFTYELPPEKIAVYPLAERDASKLLVYKQGIISEDRFKNLDAVLEEGTLLVFNNTKVVRARLQFLNAKDQPIEIFCLEPATAGQDLSTAMTSEGHVRWNCLVGNLKRWKEEALHLAKNDIMLQASIFEKHLNYVTVDLAWQPAELGFAELLEQLGHLPIPPYLKRSADGLDAQRYQTVYARHEGSVAAPTAGLHFTDRVFQKLEEKKIHTAEVTLHVGAGTFKPVKSDTMQDHDMHSEWIEVDMDTLQTLLLQKEKSIIAVGTTSLRTLETLYWMGVKAILNKESTLNGLEIKQWDVYDLANDAVGVDSSLTALMQWMQERSLEKLVCRTQILIAPPYSLKMAAGIITNFHQPQSTLLLLISAVVGSAWKDIYDYALQHDFRFLSYGDSSVLLK